MSVLVPVGSSKIENRLQRAKKKGSNKGHGPPGHPRKTATSRFSITKMALSTFVVKIN